MTNKKNKFDVSWITYESMVNGKVADFFINMKFFTNMKNKAVDAANDVFRLVIPKSKGDFNKITKDPLVEEILSTIKDIFYVGAWYRDKQMEAYFYCTADSAVALSMLLVEKDPKNIYQVKVQSDPTWSIFFEFLTPTELEVRLNSSRLQIAEMTEQKTLEQINKIEHMFYFYDRSKMLSFLQKISNEENFNFTVLQHSADTVNLAGKDAYLVKVGQELDLTGDKIFKTVEYIYHQANDFQGEYLGWDVHNDVNITFH